MTWTPLTDYSHNAQTFFNTILFIFINVVYCTIDTSRVRNKDIDQIAAGAIRKMIENRVWVDQGNSTWWCQAVIKDSKNSHCVRIVCRDEAEHNTVKWVMKAKLIEEA